MNQKGMSSMTRRTVRGHDFWETQDEGISFEDLRFKFSGPMCRSCYCIVFKTLEQY
jgi:hypothetical protein